MRRARLLWHSIIELVEQRENFGAWVELVVSVLDSQLLVGELVQAQ
jgi:hypothetical protein